MKDLVALLIQKQYTIASVESLTAGLFASKIAQVPGASKVLYGGLITYQSECKQEVLHVDAKVIKKYGVISKEVADAMALQGQKMFACDVVVSFSGNAGPDAMDGKPVGLVHMAIVVKQQLYSFENVFAGDRETIRNEACLYMYEKLLEILK